MIIQKRFILSAFFLAISIAPIIADAGPSSDSENRTIIRTEYDRTQSTPNHLVFAATLNYIRKWQEDDIDIARQIVSARMGLASDGTAEEFLMRMVSAANELDESRVVLEKAMLCVGHSHRTDKQIYLQMDNLDDARENLSRSAYRGFISGLDDKQSTMFSKWLSSMKRAYYYRTAEHESMYKDTGLAVSSHVDRVCSELEALR